MAGVGCVTVSLRRSIDRTASVYLRRLAVRRGGDAREQVLRSRVAGLDREEARERGDRRVAIAEREIDPRELAQELRLLVREREALLEQVARLFVAAAPDAIVGLRLEASHLLPVDVDQRDALTAL